jgi:exosortase/archaeosortase family protein
VTATIDAPDADRSERVDDSSRHVAAPEHPDGTEAPSRRVRVDAATRWDMRARVVAMLGIVVVAFHYSIGTLVRSASVDSPLAYLGLVPLIALAIGAARARPRVGEPEVHDRYLDRILGLPLVGVSVLAMFVLPSRMSTFFWLWRIDLLILPFFVAGTVILLFGTRFAIRTRAALAFLFVAWPVPFRMLLARWLDGFTSMSVRAVGRVVALVPLASVDRTVEGGFRIGGPAGSFQVVVASACSGANGLLGFLLIAGAVMLVSTGPKLRKAAWLALGAVVVWVFNVGRIMLIFLSGRLWGETVAIDGFHPYVGLVTFSLATLLMVWLLPRFGIQLGRGGPGATSPAAPSVRRAVPRWRALALGLTGVAVLTAYPNGDLKKVDPVASALGAPRVVPFSQVANHVEGYRTRPVDHFGWATRFFCEDADWTRYEMSGRGTAQLGGDFNVTADVVTTTELDSFSDFGVEACYRFHGYDVENLREVDLGRGQVGTILSWKDAASPVRWTALYWYWPVAGGTTQRYQRVVLLLDSSASGRVWAPTIKSGDLTSTVGLGIDQTLRGSGGATSTVSSKRDGELRNFLVAFGRDIVSSSTPRAGD